MNSSLIQVTAETSQMGISTWRLADLYEIWLLLFPGSGGGGKFVGCCLSSLLWPLQFRPGNGTTDPDILRRESRQPSRRQPHVISRLCSHPFLDSLLFSYSVRYKHGSTWQYCFKGNPCRWAKENIKKQLFEKITQLGVLILHMYKFIYSFIYLFTYIFTFILNLYIYISI
jgi:hypothetical protein